MKKKRPNRILKKYPVDTHWWNHHKGAEYVKRFVFNLPGSPAYSEVQRKKWLTRGWQKRLEMLQKKQRAAGVPDSMFVHPKAPK